MNDQLSEADVALQELYQAVILDHNKNPKNFGEISPGPHVTIQEGHNPICGDHLFLSVRLDTRREFIEEIYFKGEGCAISKASASMMTVAVKNKTIAQAKELFAEFHALLTKKIDPHSNSHHLGKLKVFSGIWKYPARVKCAGLCWHTLKAALEGGHENDIVKTEEGALYAGK